MWYYIWPIILVVLSNTVYHITSKSIPKDVNPFLSLVVTYVVGAAAALIMFFVTNKGHSIVQDLGKLNWTSFLLGFAVVGLEVGYIYLYRAGWDISVGSLVANISLAVILLAVGLLFFNEIINAKQIAGISLCIVGLVLINLK